MIPMKRRGSIDQGSGLAVRTGLNGSCKYSCKGLRLNGPNIPELRLGNLAGPETKEIQHNGKTTGHDVESRKIVLLSPYNPYNVAVYRGPVKKLVATV